MWSPSSLSVLISVVADPTVLWNPWQIPFPQQVSLRANSQSSAVVQPVRPLSCPSTPVRFHSGKPLPQQKSPLSHSHFPFFEVYKLAHGTNFEFVKTKNRIPVDAALTSKKKKRVLFSCWHLNDVFTITAYKVVFFLCINSVSDNLQPIDTNLSFDWY